MNEMSEKSAQMQFVQLDNDRKSSNGSQDLNLKLDLSKLDSLNQIKDDHPYKTQKMTVF